MFRLSRTMMSNNMTNLLDLKYIIKLYKVFEKLGLGINHDLLSNYQAEHDIIKYRSQQMLEDMS